MMTDLAMKLWHHISTSLYGDTLSFDIELLNASTHAVVSSHLSILSALLETFLSVSVGAKEDSMALFGVATMSILDLTGSLLVLYRWCFMSQTFSKLQIQRVEVYFSVAIGVLMALLGATLLQVSIVKLIIRDHPHVVGKGVLVALFGAITSFLLFVYKMKVGEVLQSLVLITDAKCTLCVSVISLAVALALIAENFVWWSDGLMGLVVSVYVLHEAFTSLRATLNEMKGGVVDDSEGDRLLKADGDAANDPEGGEHSTTKAGNQDDDPLSFTL